MDSLIAACVSFLHQLSRGDKIISFNITSLEYEEDVISAVWNHGDYIYTNIDLVFDNGTTVTVVNNHVFLDSTSKSYIELSANNVDEYVGHYFEVYGGKAKLIGYTTTTCYSSCYSLMTEKNNNAVTNGIVSRTPDPFEGYFEILAELFGNEEQLQKDIEKYGLYEYSEWADYISYEDFIAFNAPYFKIMVGKNILTESDIFELIRLYSTI